MMENIQFQHPKPSASTPNPSRYPLSLDQHLIQGDRYREAAERLEATLQNIEQLYSPSNALHTGGPECAPCAERNRRIKQGFHDYYLGNQPGRWDEDMNIYRREIEEMFNNSDISLEVIHQRFKAELRDHLRKDLCTLGPKDETRDADRKMRLEYGLLKFSIEEALPKGLQEKINSLIPFPGPNGAPQRSNTGDATLPAGFQIRLEEAQTTAERAAIYIEYYCALFPDDTPQLRNLKTKYAKHFESGMSHDTVLGMWKAEAEDMKTRELEGWQQRLAELKMAQSAHLKNKQKKIMKEDAKVKEKKHTVECSLPSCERQIDKSMEMVIECAVCDWLARKTDQRRHSYYCSQDHNDEDFYEHDRHEHACSMGNQCYYLMNPPELDACGICSDCLANDTVSFFCSQECYSQTHRDEMHYNEGDGGGFVNFQPVPGLELVFMMN